MKKFLTIDLLLAVAVFVSNIAFGQRHCNLAAHVVSPSNGQVIDTNEIVYLTWNYTNLGPDSILLGDTIYFEQNEPEWGPIKGYRIAKANVAPGSVSLIDSGMVYFHNQDSMTHFKFFACIRLIDKTEIYPEWIQIPETYIDTDTTNNKSCVLFSFLSADSTTSVLSLKNRVQNALHVFPNPAKNKIILDYELEATTDAILSIKDLSGRTLLQQTFKKRKAGNNEPLELDISSLNSGVYFIHLISGDSSAVGKIIVNH